MSHRGIRNNEIVILSPTPFCATRIRLLNLCVVSAFSSAAGLGKLFSAVAFDVKAALSEALDLDLQKISAVKRPKARMIGPRGDDVPWAKLDILAEPSDLVRNLVGHVLGVVILPRLSSNPGSYREIMSIGDFIFRRDPWAERGVGILPLR